MVLTPTQTIAMTRVAVDIAVKVGKSNSDMFGTSESRISDDNKRIRFNILIEMIIMYFKYEYDYGKTTNHQTVTVGISRIEDVFMFYVALLVDLYHDAKFTRIEQFMKGSFPADKDTVKYVMNFIKASGVCDARVVTELDSFTTDPKYSKTVSNIRNITDDLFLTKTRKGWIGASEIENRWTDSLNYSLGKSGDGYVPTEHTVSAIATQLVSKGGGVIFDQSSKGASTALAQAAGVGIYLSTATGYDGGSTQGTFIPNGIYSFFHTFCKDAALDWLNTAPNLPDDEGSFKRLRKFCTDFEYGNKITVPQFKKRTSGIFDKFHFDISVEQLYSVQYKRRILISTRYTNKSVQHIKAAVGIPMPTTGEVKYGTIAPVSTISAAFKGINDTYGALYKTIGDLNLILYSSCFPGKVVYTTGDRSANAIATLLAAVGVAKKQGNVYERPVNYAFEIANYELLTNIFSRTNAGRRNNKPSQTIVWAHKGVGVLPNNVPFDYTNKTIPTWFPVTNLAQKNTVMYDVNKNRDEYLIGQLMRILKIKNTENAKRKLNQLLGIPNVHTQGPVEYIEKLERRLKNPTNRKIFTNYLKDNRATRARGGLLPNSMGPGSHPKDFKEYVRGLQGVIVEHTILTTAEKKNLLSGAGIPFGEKPKPKFIGDLFNAAKSNGRIGKNVINAAIEAKEGKGGNAKAPPRAKALSVMKGKKRQPLAAGKGVSKKLSNARAVKAKTAAIKTAAIKAVANRNAANRAAQNATRAARAARAARVATRTPARTPAVAKRKRTPQANTKTSTTQNAANRAAQNAAEENARNRAEGAGELAGMAPRINNNLIRKRGLPLSKQQKK